MIFFWFVQLDDLELIKNTKLIVNKMRKKILYFFVMLLPILMINLSAEPKSSMQGFSKKRYRIGDFAQGGVVIYLTPDGMHGLVAAIEDVGEFQWSPIGVATSVSGADDKGDLPLAANEEYPGQNNTRAIINTFGRDNPNHYAAQAAVAYSKTVNGKTYDDWFLPSMKEFGVMWSNSSIVSEVSIREGGSALSDPCYWTSLNSPLAQNSAYVFLASDDEGFISRFGRSNSYKVRPVRAF